MITLHAGRAPYGAFVISRLWELALELRAVFRQEVALVYEDSTGDIVTISSQGLDTVLSRGENEGRLPGGQTHLNLWPGGPSS